MAMKVTGTRQCVERLNKIIDDIQGRKAVRAIQASMLVGAAQAAVYTPIDTATLINSQFREIVIKGSRITGRVGYTASYAAYVNDPKIKMNFRRATAEKEFLKKGFDDTADLRLQVIKKEMAL